MSFSSSSSRVYQDLLRQVYHRPTVLAELPDWFQMLHGVPMGFVLSISCCIYIFWNIFWNDTAIQQPFQTAKPWIVLVLLTMLMICAALYASPSEMFVLTEVHMIILIYGVCEALIAFGWWMMGRKYADSESTYVLLTAAALYAIYYVFSCLLNLAHYEEIRRFSIHMQRMRDDWTRKELVPYFLRHWDDVTKHIILRHRYLSLRSSAFWFYWRQAFQIHEFAKKSVIQSHLVIEDLADLVVDYYLCDYLPGVAADK